jgi:hypothetical protein
MAEVIVVLIQSMMLIYHFTGISPMPWWALWFPTLAYLLFQLLYALGVMEPR